MGGYIEADHEHPLPCRLAGRAAALHIGGRGDAAGVRVLPEHRRAGGQRHQRRLGLRNQHHLRAGRVAVALSHADQMLRVQPELAERLFPMLAELADKWPSAQALVTDQRFSSASVITGCRPNASALCSANGDEPYNMMPGRTQSKWVDG